MLQRSARSLFWGVALALASVCMLMFDQPSHVCICFLLFYACRHTYGVFSFVLWNDFLKGFRVTIIGFRIVIGRSCDRTIWFTQQMTNCHTCGFHTIVAQRGPVRIYDSKGPLIEILLNRPSQQLYRRNNYKEFASIMIDIDSRVSWVSCRSAPWFALTDEWIRGAMRGPLHFLPVSCLLMFHDCTVSGRRGGLGRGRG